MEQIDDARPPWKTAWGRHKAEGVEPSYREHVQTGLWIGMVSRAGICGALLMASFGWNWRAPQAAGPEISLGTGASGNPLTGKIWWGTLILVGVSALAMRVPRMNHSLWGDEADATASYVHGMWRPEVRTVRQGALKFEQPTWEQTFYSAKHGPNNHVLFSVLSRICLNTWQNLTHKSTTVFTEWPLRVPSLVAGIASLFTLAALLRYWRVPWLGLLAVIFMAVHPWHIRYSTEARGYALMLALLPLVILFLSKAIRDNQWRHWIVFALLEFLLMWSWGGVVYGLAAVNLVALGVLLSREGRWCRLARFATAHLLAAMVFISLYAPQLTQIDSARAKLQWIKGLPMDEIWLHNLIADAFTGIYWHGREVGNPVVQSWENVLDTYGRGSWFSLGLIAAVFLAGLWWLWRHYRRTGAWMITGILLSAVVCAVHFKYGIGDELRSWYLIFILPAYSIVMAVGIAALACKWFQNRSARAVVCGAILALVTLPFWPANWSQMRDVFEDMKMAAHLTSGQHGPFDPADTSRVFCHWLWRYNALYDPRGHIHTRSGPSLQKAIDAAEAVDGVLYVIVGYRELAMGICPDMIQMVEDKRLFDRVETLWSRNPIQTLYIYRVKSQP